VLQAMQENGFRIEIDDGIALFALDRPPVNAIDLQLVRDAEEALMRLEASRDARAVVITGAGSCFSAGLDLDQVPSYGPDEQRQMVHALNRMLGRLYGIGIPTVAAVNGHAIAGGLVLVLACDHRVGTQAPARLGLSEARAGIPFPVGPLAVVTAELAPAVARGLMLRARDLGPDEALAKGILDELQPAERVLPRAREIAGELAAAPREGYARIKRQLRAPALARIAEAVESGRDPVLQGWIGEEGRRAADALLESERGG
jgi:enoyl-CoA hydratase